MKGLKHIPSTRQLALAYSALRRGEVSDSKLVLYSQWTRLDPRLGELIVQYIAGFWKEVHPVCLNSCIQNQVWPAVFGVLLDHVPFYYKKKKIKNQELVLFRKWADCVMAGIQPVSGELFFIDIYSTGSKLMYEEAFYSGQIYRKWGYFGKDLMINKMDFSQKTLISFQQRREILNHLLKRKQKLRVEDYIKELNFQIHRRQAQRDLKNHPLLCSHGNTANKIYYRK